MFHLDIFIILNLISNRSFIDYVTGCKVAICFPIREEIYFPLPCSRQAVGPIQSPMQQLLGTFVEEETDHSSLSSAKLKMHEFALVFPYALMACGMVFNITQGHGSTHITFCKLLLVTISESVLLKYYTENVVKNTTGT